MTHEVRNELINKGIEFELFVNEDKVRMKEVYYLRDGGYHRWTCKIPPFKHTSSRADTSWTKWVESVRKDVECCFGILKGRFRILRSGIVLQSQTAIDNVFFTCSIPHNRILEADGLDTRWEQNVEWDMLNPQSGISDDGYDGN